MTGGVYRDCGDDGLGAPLWRRHGETRESVLRRGIAQVQLTAWRTGYGPLTPYDEQQDRLLLIALQLELSECEYQAAKAGKGMAA